MTFESQGRFTYEESKRRRNRTQERTEAQRLSTSLGKVRKREAVMTAQIINLADYRKAKVFVNPLAVRKNRRSRVAHADVHAPVSSMAKLSPAMITGSHRSSVSAIASTTGTCSCTPSTSSS
jgi:hypothetical protein